MTAAGPKLWWCPTCGVVWTADEAPLCKHFAVDGPAATRMEPLPTYHPFSLRAGGKA